MLPEPLPIFTQTRCRVNHAVFANAATVDRPAQDQKNSYFWRYRRLRQYWTA